MTGIEGIAAIGHADAAPIAMRLGEATAMQVRSRIVEGYREIMNIPL